MSNIRQLASMPAAVLAQIPAGRPPPGVIPDFAHPATRVPTILGASFALFALALVFVAVRMYMRIFVLKKWKPEDTCILLAFIFGVFYQGAAAQDCIHGQAGKHSYEQHLDTLLFPGWYFTYFIHNAFTYFPLGLIKIGILFQFWRLFSPKKWMRICIYIGMAVVIPSFIGLGIVAIIFNASWPGEDQISTILSWHFNYAGKFVNPIGVIDVICDFYLLLIPLPLVYTLQLSKARKIGLILVFLTGTFTCISSILSCYYRFHQDPLDGVWSAGWLLMWILLEIWTGIIVACMPSFHQFWNRHTGLVWLSNEFKSKLAQVVTRSRNSGSKSSRSNQEKDQTAEDRTQMVKVPSVGSKNSDNIELADSPSKDKHTYVVSGLEHGSQEELEIQYHAEKPHGC